MLRTEAILTVTIVLLLVVISLLWQLPTARIGFLVGESMDPTMSEGDLTIYEPTEASVGDVIVFQEQTESGASSLISHRVIMKNDSHYITKGDNNTFIDNPVLQESSNYKGRIIYRIPLDWSIPIDKPEIDLRAGS